MVNRVKYQVALSFAGEQRDYVEEVARHLQNLKIAIFYDEFAIVNLWGKSGAIAFEQVFAKDAAYVVMFISQNYVEKSWPIFERKAALSRMILEQREYILPVRFDETPVPGLPQDTIYLSAGDYSPAELSALIAEKLGIERFHVKASDLPPPRMTSLVGEPVFDYASYNGRYIIGSEKLEFETNWSKASDTSIHIYNDPPSINGIALAHQYESISQLQHAATLDFTSRACRPSIGQIVVLRNAAGFYAALTILKIKNNTRGDNQDELRFRYIIQSNGSDSFENIS